MFINKFGLINAHSRDIVSENTILFTTEYLLLNKCNKRHFMFKNLANFIEKCRVNPGLFRQHPEIQGNHDDYTSHDSLTGLVAFSHYYGLNYHHEIWSYLWRHMFTYDNVSARINLKRIMHPRDILYYGYCANNIICKILYPILLTIMSITVMQKYKIRNGAKIVKTDGKLLAWTRCKASNLKLSFKILTFLLKKFSIFNSWSEVFSTYFKEPNHPNRINT